MKRSFVITIALILVAAVSLCFAVGIDMAKYEVEFTSKDLLGDPSCAEGLDISYKLETARRAFWYNNIKLGKDGFNADSKFEFKPIAPYYYNDDSVDRIVAVQSINDIELEKSVPDGIEEELRASGGELTKHFKYTDFYDYYNMILDIYIDGMYTSSYITAYEGENHIFLREDELEFWKKFNKFFKIPVLENEIVDANYRMYGDGKISSWYYAGDGTTYWPEFYTAVSDDSMYFTMGIRAGDEIVDTSLIPGGYGIYMLPYDPTMTFEDSNGYSAFVKGKVNIDNLRMVYPLDTSAEVAAMGISSDKSHLYYVSYEDEKIMFRNISLSDMTCIQEICLGSIEGWIYFTQQDNFIVFELNDDYDIKVVAETSPNYYELIVDFDGSGKNGDTSNYFWKENYRYNFSYACDGERLAVVSHTNEEAYIGYPSASTGVIVAIYEDSELKYCGEYDSTLRYLQVPKDAKKKSTKDPDEYMGIDDWNFYLLPRDKIEVQFNNQ